MKTTTDPILCPVCGYDLGFRPWRGSSASHQICPSCGIEFGYDDVPEGGGLTGTKEEIYNRWRDDWVAQGMRWWSGSRSMPDGWDPCHQLKRIGIALQRGKP